MVGSISLLLDSHTVTTTEDKSRLYCNTLTTVQDMMEFGGFDTIPGISSTENLQLQQDAELSANPYACLSSKIETITTNELTGVSIPKEFETDKSNTDEHHQSTYMYSFAGGMVMASGACLVVAMIVSRRRRQRLHFQRPPPLASPPSSFDFPVQQVVTERSIRSSAVSSLHDDEHPGAFVF